MFHIFQCICKVCRAKISSLYGLKLEMWISLRSELETCKDEGWHVHHMENIAQNSNYTFQVSLTSQHSFVLLIEKGQIAGVRCLLPRLDILQYQEPLWFCFSPSISLGAHLFPISPPTCLIACVLPSLLSLPNWIKKLKLAMSCQSKLFWQIQGKHPKYK